MRVPRRGSSTLRGTTAGLPERVVVGAQVSYPDLRGFGRRFLDIEPDALTDDVLYQIGGLEALCRAAGTRVRYVKPHGALYNATRTHTAQARAVVRAVLAYDPSLPVLGLPGSVLLAEAERAGLRTVGEFFVDRGYTPEGGLVPRSEPGALLDDATEAAERLVRMVGTGTVRAVDGSEVAVRAESACLHGDSPVPSRPPGGSVTSSPGPGSPSHRSCER